MQDIQLIKNSNDRYDISIANGDVVMDQSFDTAIVISLFSNARADENEVPKPSNRQGVWYSPDVGSKLWIALTSRKTNDTLNKARDYTKSCLQWLIDDGYLKNIEVNVELISKGIVIKVYLIRFDSRIETRFYQAWENSEF